MSITRSGNGDTTVSPEGPIKATARLAKAIKAIANHRAAIKALKVDEREAYDTIIEAVADRPAIILDGRGNVICEVVEITSTTTKVDDFVDALLALYPELSTSLRDTWPEAVDAAKKAAARQTTYRKVLPK